MIRWKDEGPGGPVWFNDVVIDDVLHTNVRIENDNGPVWFTQSQAEALASSLGLEIEYA